MSWTEDNRTQHACPCGQGTWVEVSESDDWNRSRTYAAINCATCRETHRIEEIHGNRKGMATIAYRIVPRDGKPDTPRYM